MRRFVLPLALAVIATGATGTTRAEPAPPSAAADDEPAPADLDVPLAFASNVPFAWPWSQAFSAWLGLNDHHAIRANYARYRGPLWTAIKAGYLSEGPKEGDVRSDFGQTTDLSVGWVYFPRRVLDGATLEASALLRLNRLRDRIDSENVAAEEQFTNVYSVRTLAGWTWRLSDSWFIALSVGASAGYERGREKKFLGYDHSNGGFMEITQAARVSRVAWSREAYLRIGLTLGQ